MIQKAAKPVLFLLVFSGFILLIFLVMQPLEVIAFLEHVVILNPKGEIGREQRDLLLFIQALMLLVIIPVYVFTFIFSWKYSVYHKKAKYDPDLVDHRVAEYFWWGVPTLLTLVIAWWTYVKTDQLDPYKPLVSDKKTQVIQVVALQWKWLFIYPEEKIASVNFLQFPVDTPVRFEITADAPMNSFWIPQLGGQIYAMPAMKTLLHLIADEVGNYRGSSANLSGEGFSRMNFVARASTKEEFEEWVQTTQQSGKILDYEELVKPSVQEVELYGFFPDGLFDEIVMKYMHGAPH